jgi:hypothetical protein
VVSGVSARCDHLSVGVIIMALTCGWQVSFAGDHDARVVLRVFSSHMRYIRSKGTVSCFSVLCVGRLLANPCSF